MVRAMVHSVKHYVQHSLNTITASTQSAINIIDAVAVVDKNAVQEVTEGSTIKAVYFEEWLRSSEISPGSFIATVTKVPAGGGTPSTTEIAALGDYNNKKNVLYTTQGLLNDQDADATVFLKGWIKIPKSKQRFGLGDKLILTIFAQGAIDLVHCGFTTYKEYT